jgi:hypothetical protein
VKDWKAKKMSGSQFPPLESKQSSKRCTNCSALMSLYALPGHYGQNIDIDVCMDCNAIWFDNFESTQLSPDGVVTLFQLINERGGTASSAGAKFGEGLRCVTCGDSMKLTNDRVRNTRFVYQSCRQGHGRFTTFYNFLSEKQFVRELTQTERTKLAASVKQVKCSGCGAPVDLSKADACTYCRAPVSVFDRDAAKKAIDHYLRERQKQLPTQPSRDYGYSNHRQRNDGWNTWDTLYAADLATDLLWALGRAASRGLAGASRAVPVGAGTGAAAGATSVLADTGTAATGGLLNSLHNGTTSIGGVNAIPTATDALFGSAGRESALIADAAATMFGNAGGSLSGAADSLPSATDALFGSGNAADTFSSLADSLGGGIGDGASSIADSAIDAVGSGAFDSVADVASDAGGGIADLVGDGIGSLIGELFS